MTSKQDLYSRHRLTAIEEVPAFQHERGGVAVWLMAAMRLAFFCGLLLFAWHHRWNDLTFHALIFFGSAFVPMLGRRNRGFYLLDFWIMLVFTGGIVMTLYGQWPEPRGFNEILFGTDKLFHIAAGACLAMFAAILLRPYITHAWMFYGMLVVFAIAVGAVWEVFEWCVSELPSLWLLRSAGYTDSMLDLIADTIGAVMVVVVLKFRGYYYR